MGIFGFGMIGLNVAYWLYFENVIRTDEAKKVGYDEADDKGVPKKEYGNTSFYIAASQLVLYVAPPLLRRLGCSYMPIAGFHSDVFTPLHYGAIALSIFAFALRRYAMKTLGKFFSRKLGIQGDHHVVKDGPYSLVRNPGYAANAILFLAYSLSLSGDVAIGLAIYLQWLFVLLQIRIKGEEEMLLTDKATGDEYKKYMKEVKYKLFPFLV